MTQFQLDCSRSRIEFGVRHMLVSTVRGHFSEFEADISVDPNNIEAGQVRAKVDVCSVNTHEKLRDDYLRGEFFAPEKYPAILFSSTRAQLRGRKVTIHGDLTIREVTRSIVLEGTMNGPSEGWSGSPQRLTFDLKGEIERERFGLSFPKTVETVSVVVGKKVSLQLHIELAATAAAAALAVRRRALR